MAVPIDVAVGHNPCTTSSILSTNSYHKKNKKKKDKKKKKKKKDRQRQTQVRHRSLKKKVSAFEHELTATKPINAFDVKRLIVRSDLTTTRPKVNERTSASARRERDSRDEREEPTTHSDELKRVSPMGTN